MNKTTNKQTKTHTKNSYLKCRISSFVQLKRGKVLFSTEGFFSFWLSASKMTKTLHEADPRRQWPLSLFSPSPLEQEETQSACRLKRKAQSKGGKHIFTQLHQRGEKHWNDVMRPSTNGSEEGETSGDLPVQTTDRHRTGRDCEERGDANPSVRWPLKRRTKRL